MFNIEQFIIIVKDKNKTIFSAESIKITPKNLEDQLRYAYKKGYADAEEYYKNLENLRNIGKNKSNPLDIFSDIFGGKK